MHDLDTARDDLAEAQDRERQALDDVLQRRTVLKRITAVCVLRSSSHLSQSCIYPERMSLSTAGLATQETTAPHPYQITSTPRRNLRKNKR